jgi:hypothetical protein
MGAAAIMTAAKIYARTNVAVREPFPNRQADMCMCGPLAVVRGLRTHRSARVLGSVFAPIAGPAVRAVARR